MNITYNAETNPSNLITFSDIPNILKVEDSSGGTYARITLTFTGNLYTATTADNQWNITVNGESITNTTQPQNAKNKHFYVGTSNNSIAASVTMALRNCSTISANYTIQNTNNQVVLTARGIGVMWPDGATNHIETNIDSSYLTWAAIDGSANSDLNGAEIIVEVLSNGEYVTTMHKYWWGGEAAFNLTPLLCTLSQPLKVVPYTMNISSLKNGEYASIGSIGENYTTVGYMVNFGEKYLDNSIMQVAQNIHRGSYNPDCANRTVLYVYEPTIPISFYAGNSGGMYITTEYLNSAKEVIGSQQMEWTNTDDAKKLWHVDIVMNNLYFYQAFYIDITLGNIKLRYKTTRPFSMTEECTRLYWVNSYGGQSFFDACGKKEEARSLETTTYQKSVFDYYTADMEELDKVYDSTVQTDITVKSHLIEKDATYVFDDLMQSPMVWTVIEGKKYGVIIDSVNVDELENNNNVFQATIRYRLSQPTTLI